MSLPTAIHPSASLTSWFLQDLPCWLTSLLSCPSLIHSPQNSQIICLENKPNNVALPLNTFQWLPSLFEIKFNENSSILSMANSYISTTWECILQLFSAFITSLLMGVCPSCISSYVFFFDFYHTLELQWIGTFGYLISIFLPQWLVSSHNYLIFFSFCP